MPSGTAPTVDPSRIQGFGNATSEGETDHSSRFTSWDSSNDVFNNLEAASQEIYQALAQIGSNLQVGYQRVKSAFNCQAPEQQTLSAEQIVVEHAWEQVKASLSCSNVDESHVDNKEFKVDVEEAERETPATSEILPHEPDQGTPEMQPPGPCHGTQEMSSSADLLDLSEEAKASGSPDLLDLSQPTLQSESKDSHGAPAESQASGQDISAELLPSADLLDFSEPLTSAEASTSHQDCSAAPAESISAEVPPSPELLDLSEQAAPKSKEVQQPSLVKSDADAIPPTVPSHEVERPLLDLL